MHDCTDLAQVCCGCRQSGYGNIGRCFRISYTNWIAKQAHEITTIWVIAVGIDIVKIDCTQGIIAAAKGCTGTNTVSEQFTLYCAIGSGTKFELRPYTALLCIFDTTIGIYISILNCIIYIRRPIVIVSNDSTFVINNIITFYPLKPLCC